MPSIEFFCTFAEGGQLSSLCSQCEVVYGEESNWLLSKQ